MDLRRRLHDRRVASIENIHSSSCNERMAQILRQRKPCGDSSCVLADLLLLVRARGSMTLEDAREHLCISARAFEQALISISKSRHGIWKGPTFIIAPFSVGRGPNVSRSINAQPSKRGIIASEFIKSNIRARGDDHPADECAPGWYPSKINSRTRVGVFTSRWGSGGGFHINRSCPSGGFGIKVGVLASDVIESMQVNPFPSLRSGKEGELLAQRRASELDEVRPIKHYDTHTCPQELTSDRTMTLQHSNLDIDGYGLEVAGADAAAPQVATEQEVAAAPKQGPKRQSKGKRTKVAAGSDDQRFVKVWNEHRKVHEKWDANGVAAEDGSFGLAGVGNRQNAWLMWQKLTEIERAAAADKVAITLEWRLRMGWKPQQVYFYLKDRSWRQTDPAYRKQAPIRKDKASKSAQVACTTDFGLDAFRYYLKTGRFALIGNDPSDLPTWPAAERARFVSTVQKAIGIGGDKVLEILKKRSARAHKHVCAAIGRSTETATRPIRISAPVRSMEQAVPARARFNREQVEAYCASVGVSSMPDRMARAQAMISPFQVA